MNLVNQYICTYNINPLGGRHGMSTLKLCIVEQQQRHIRDDKPETNLLKIIQGS